MTEHDVAGHEHGLSGAGRYAELHAHSAFSFLDGASQPEDLVAEAARLGLSAMAITDHDGLYGVVRFAEAARRVGLPTVIGAELGLGAAERRAGPRDPGGTHLLVLTRGPQGYRSLSRAIAEANLAGGGKGLGAYVLPELAAAADGQWLVLTGCRKGPVRQALAGGREIPGGPVVASGGMAAARDALDDLIALFGRENVAVEITATGTASDAERNQALAELAEQTGLPLVATGAVHCARPSDQPVADVLAAIRARATLAEIDGWLPPMPAHLRSPAEMTHLHRQHPQAVATAAELAAECAFDLRLVAPNLPPHPVPRGHTEATWLRELTHRMARERYGPPEAERVEGAYATLDRELGIIIELGFPGYFLIVHEIVDFCRRRGILCQGRGSAANSAVCYALGITAVDAVRHKMLFERFLSPGRAGYPDIDLDIESGRREEVIQFVYDRYGRTHAAQVANVISYRPRSAVRDVGRALGYDIGQQDAWSRAIDQWGSLRNPRSSPPPRPWWSGQRDRDEGLMAAEAEDRETEAMPEREPAMRSPAPTGRAERKDAAARRDPPPPAPEAGAETDAGPDGVPDEVVDLAERLLKLPRHLGLHPGGMVLCDRPVIEVCPVEWATMPGRTALQWDKDDCADAGLVKFDLLGLGMLTALRLAFESVAAVGGPELTLGTLPQEDPRVYELLCAADTIGVFQVESRAQMSTLPRLRPRVFYDIVVEVALIRPGPIQGQSVSPYIQRATGKEKVSYLHPLLEPALKRTLGVPLFQEQLMQIAVDVAGFDAAEADQLRRAMGAKRSEEKMAALRGRLLEGMAAKGVSHEIGEQIYAKLLAFADFGFPESHAFSFAYLVYASSWLKVHHPEAFYAALLAAQPMGFYSPQSLVADARRHGVRVLRADVQSSQERATVERRTVTAGSGEAGTQDAADAAYGDAAESLPPVHGADPAALVDPDPDLAVRLGLSSIRGVGERGAERIVAERNRGGRFRDIADLAQRAGLTTAQLEWLATAGALECFGADRRRSLWTAGAVASSPGMLPHTVAGEHAPMLPGMDDLETAVADVWSTGVSVDSFPTQFLRPGLRAEGVLTIADLRRCRDGERVSVAGVVTHRQRPGTASGIVFLSLEDETGLLNVVCNPGMWKRYRREGRMSAALVVRGRVESAQGVVNLVAERLRDLSLRIPSRSRDFR